MTSKKNPGIKEPVLIVDDEEEIAKLIAAEAERMGYQAVVRFSAVDALEYLKTNPSPFLIISDFRMPEMTGVDFCIEAKKIKSDVPFVLCSGFVDKEVAVAGLKNGIEDVIEKPFPLTVIQDLLEKHALARKTQIESEAKELDEITQIFTEEATALLEDLEKHILRLEDDPLDPAVVDLLFRNVHSVKGGAGAVPGGKWLAQLGHSFESCLSMIKSGKLRLDSAGMELFLLTSDLCQKLVHLIKSRQEPDSELAQAIQICIQSLDAVKSGKTAGTQAPTATAQPSVDLSKKEKTDKKEQGNDDGVWVSNEKLDSFMKLSGELIVLKNYFQVLNQEADLKSVSNRVSGKITDFSYSLNKITDSLQDQIMSIRKVTLERALSKLPRIFRQVTKEVDKKVSLVTEGFGLGVDRTIANALSACMTHMLRNAIDHGIESAEKRHAAGKSVEGKIVISAKEQKGTIYLTISDDGGGIDRSRVVAKAIEKGLLDESKGATLTDEEAYDLLFLPGFSTAEKVTGISGRGVGMDVVKSEIVNLKGRVRIESQLKKGTTFHIEVPVPKTVMVEQTVLVKSREALIAVPLNAIAQLTTCGALSTTVVGHQMTCQFQGRTVLLKTYSELVGQDEISSDAGGESCSASEQPVVILQHKSEFVGLLVDSIHDQLEAVIRPFDKVTNHFVGFKGTTVLGDDNIAYVISPDEFVLLGLKSTTKEAAA